MKNSVSIVIPTFNMAWCIERAVKSCLKQTVKSPGIIVIDDASTDNTSTVVKKLASKHPNIRYIRQEKNVGAAQAMMVGVKAARSIWVAFLDADDELTPNSLESRLNIIQNYSYPDKLGFVYGNIYVEKEGGLKLIKNKLISGYQYPYLTKELSLCQQIVVLVRKQYLLDSGYPTIYLPSSTDDDMILTIAKKYEIGYTTDPVAIIHLHDSTSRMTNNREYKLEIFIADGTAGLIAKYKPDIIRYHGYPRLFLWYLRLFRRRIEAEIDKGHNTIFTYFLKVMYQILQYIVLKTFDIHWL